MRLVMDEPFWIIFDGPPSHESGRFVEVENGDGASVRVGKWGQRADGYWTLGPLFESWAAAGKIERLQAALARYGNHLASCKAVDTFQHADCDCGFGVIEEEEGL